MSGVTIGIDIGGPSKGFHAVALRDRQLVGKFANKSAASMAAWCAAQSAEVIAIDAPCRWRGVGRPARAAERHLARDGISSFSTPIQAHAGGRAFYTWMFSGMEVYAALAAEYPLYDGEPTPKRVCIETFPQAVACALAGKIVSAKQKHTIRRQLIQESGLDETDFANIDEIDAALCALAAEAFARKSFRSYGDIEGGFIIVPTWNDRALAAEIPAPAASKNHRRPPLSLNGIIAALPALSTADRKRLREHLAAFD